VIVGHVGGVPVEETIMQLAPAGMVLLAIVASTTRAAVARLRRSVRRGVTRTGA
jgi:hypothetical protein